MISLDSNGNNDLISEEDLMDLVKADILRAILIWMKSWQAQLTQENQG